MLELLDRRRQRGLGDEQLLRGTPVVQLLAEDDEVSELAQRDSGVLAARRRTSITRYVRR
jgi:hypothetical protein